MKKITIGMLLLAGCMSAAAELEMFTESGPGSVGIMRTKMNAGFAQVNSNNTTLLVSEYFQVKNTNWDNPIALLVDTNGNTTVGGDLYAAGNQIKLGTGAGAGATNDYQIFIGDNSGLNSTGSYFTALGTSAGRMAKGIGATAVGNFSALMASGTEWHTLGRIAGGYSTGDNWTAVGEYSGYYGLGNKWMAVGRYAGRNAVSNMFYIDHFTADPGAGHNPANENIVIDGTTGTMTLGRPSSTVTLRGALSAPSATYSSGNSVLNATALDTRFQNASSGISMTLRTRKYYQNPGFKRIEADESVSWMATLCHDETLTVAGCSDADANGLYSWYADTAPNGRYYRRTAGGKTFQISGDYSADNGCYLERVLPTQANLSSSGVDNPPYEGPYFPPRTGWSGGVTVTYTGNFDINARWYFRTLKSTTAPTDDGWEEFNEADFLLGLPSAQAIDYIRWKCVPSAESGLSQDDDLTMFSGYRRAASQWEKYGTRWQSPYYNYVKMIPVEAQSEGN